MTRLGAVALALLSLGCPRLAEHDAGVPVQVDAGIPADVLARTRAAVTPDGKAVYCGHSSGRWFLLSWEEAVVQQDGPTSVKLSSFATEFEQDPSARSRAPLRVLSVDYDFDVPPAIAVLAETGASGDSVFSSSLDGRLSRGLNPSFEFNADAKLVGYWDGFKLHAFDARVRSLCRTLDTPRRRAIPPGLVVTTSGVGSLDVHPGLVLSTVGDTSLVWTSWRDTTLWVLDGGVAAVPLEMTPVPGNPELMQLPRALTPFPMERLAELSSILTISNPPRVGWTYFVEQDGKRKPGTGNLHIERVRHLIAPQIKGGTVSVGPSDAGCSLTVQLERSLLPGVVESLRLGEPRQFPRDARVALGSPQRPPTSPGRWTISDSTCDGLVERALSVEFELGNYVVRTPTQSTRLGTMALDARTVVSNERELPRDAGLAGPCVEFRLSPTTVALQADGGVLLIDGQARWWMEDLTLDRILTTEDGALLVRAWDGSIRARHRLCTPSVPDSIRTSDCPSPALAESGWGSTASCATHQPNLAPQAVVDARGSIDRVVHAGPDLVEMHLRQGQQTFVVKLPWEDYRTSILTADGVVGWSSRRGLRRFCVDGGVEQLAAPVAASAARVLGSAARQ